MPEEAITKAAENKKRTRGTRRARSERGQPPGGASIGMRKRHSKAKRATRRYICGARNRKASTSTSKGQMAKGAARCLLFQKSV